jgi:two-component system, response regulator RegA
MDATVSPIERPDWRRSGRTQLIGQQGKPAVLIADPEINSESTLARRLVREGLRVHFAATLSELRTLVAQRRLDYALTEVSFIDGDAINVIKTLQSSVPRCRIIVHSRVQLAICRKSHQSGASDVLPKPAEIDFLLAIL